MSIGEQYKGFIDRLKTEKSELAAKLQGIEHFVERNMPGASDAQKTLIQAQHSVMQAYHSILTVRLADLHANEKPSTVASAIMPELGEPKEIVNADEDRDGPVPFGG